MQPQNPPALARLANPKFPGQLMPLDEIDSRYPSALCRPEVVDQDRVTHRHLGEPVTVFRWGLYLCLAAICVVHAFGLSVVDLHGIEIGTPKQFLSPIQKIGSNQ